MLSTTVDLAIEQSSRIFLLGDAETEIYSNSIVMSIILPLEGTGIHLTSA